jgi:hypothetical protein
VRQRVRGEVAGASFAMVVDLDEWGSPLGVAIPPEEEVVAVAGADIAQLLGTPAGTVGS